MKKFFSLFAAVLFAGSMMAEAETIFTYNGKGVTTAEEIVKAGGTLTVYGGNTNIVADQKQKGNMCIKINKGFTKSGVYYYMAITLDQPLQAGDKITTAAFRTGTQDCVYGMDFNVATDSASATDAVQVLFDNNLQVLSSDGVPADTTFEVPAAAAGAKFIRLYRKSGATGLWIANFTITREGGVTPPEPTCTLSDFLGNGSGNAAYTDRFKVCLPEGVSVVNIQSSFGTEAGIYLTFPGADFGAVSLDATQYATQGAGMLLYVSAFLSAAETEVTVECGGVTYTITVLNANPETPALPDPTNCAEAREAALSVEANNVPYKDSTIYSIQGYVTEIKTAYNDQFHNITFWMADAANGGQVLQAYRAACASADEAPIVGDKVTVTGALSKYNGTPQFMAGSTFVIDEHATPVVPQNLGEKTIAEFLTLANTVDTCVITGVVANIKTNTDGSYNKFGNFDLVDGEASVYVYGLLTAAGEAQKFQEMGVDAGDTLTVKAVYSLYNNAPQVKNAIFVAVKKYVEPVVFNHELYGSEALPVVDKTWFATTDSWVEENNSHAEIVNDYDIHVALVDSKVGQWQSQVFVNPGFTWEVGAYYKMEFDLTTNNQLGGVTVKVNDNDSVVFYYSYPNDNVFLANQTTHFVADSIYAKAEPTNGGQLIFAFGWTAANTEILISNIVITKYEAPVEPQEIVLDVEYADAMHITQYGAWQLNLYKDYSQAEGVTYPDFYVILAEKSATTLAGTYSAAAGEIMLVQVFTSEKDSASAVQVTPFVITYKGDGVYNFNFAFLGDDGNTYILDTDLAPGAYEYGTWADIVLEDVAEGIENTEVLLNATKRIENGTLIIERNNVRYNVSGQVVR